MSGHRDQGAHKLTIFGEQIVCPADDKLHDDPAEFLEFFLALSFDSIAGHGIAPTDDRVFEVLAEIAFRTQEIGICEVQK